MIGKKLKIKGKSVRLSRSEANKLKELHAFFETPQGKTALLHLRKYCRIGMEAPKDPAQHSFVLGMNEPYTRLVGDIRLGYLARDGQLEILDPMEEDVYGGTSSRADSGAGDGYPGTGEWGLNRE